MTDCQRWRAGRASYRPAREVINTNQFDVEEFKNNTEPRAFVETHHYSHSWCAARRRFGLMRHGELVGAAVFAQPTNDLTLTNVFPSAKDSMVLSKLVLLDEIGANAESWFVARCFALLRSAGVRGVVSFSDPVPRRTAAGLLVMPGHVGIVYQALNATYLGRSSPDTQYLLPDGTVFEKRRLSKIRQGERGWWSAVEHLLTYGARPLAADASEAERKAWVRETTAQLLTTVRHPGNHKYAWALDRAIELPRQVYNYPKLKEAA